MPWQQPLLEVPSKSESSFCEKVSLNFSTTQFNAAIFLRLKSTVNFLLKRNVHVARVLVPYRISSPTHSNTFVVILHVRIWSWEINASFATISIEQENLRNNLLFLLDLYYPVLIFFFDRYKDFLTEKISFFTHTRQCSNCATRIN